MKTLFNDVIILILILPLLIAYGKGYGYYNEVVFEPTVGMPCGDGTPNEIWFNQEKFYEPTYDCMTIEHHMAYAKWFANTTSNILAENQPEIDKVKTYIKELSIVIGEVIQSIMKSLL